MQPLITSLAFFMVLLLTAASAAQDAADEASRPILRIESDGHTAICKWLGFTPDGRHLVSAGEDKVIRVWAVNRQEDDSEHGPRIQVLLERSIRLQIGPGSEGKIYAGAISPNPSPVVDGYQR